MSEYEDKMQKLRLPQSYKLTGGPEGTGKIKVPKGMLDEQALAYDAAIQRRKNPGRQDAYDTIAAKLKKNAQAYERKKLGKSRPTYFPQEEKEEDSPKLPAFSKKIGMESEPVSGDYDTGDALARGEISHDDWVADIGLPPLKPGQKVVQKMGPDGNIISQIIDPPKGKKDPIATAGDVFAPHAPEDVDTGDEYEREEFGMDASAEQFQNEYADQDPVNVSSTEVDGNEDWIKAEYEDGAIWLISPDGDPVRQENVTPESDYKAGAEHTAKFTLDPSSGLIISDLNQ